MVQKANIIVKIRELVLLNEEEKEKLIASLEHATDEQIEKLDKVLEEELDLLFSAIKQVTEGGDFEDSEAFLKGFVQVMKETGSEILKAEEAAVHVKEDKEAEQLLQDLE
jgi:thioredoxin-like negative regulator of GroEL